MYLSKVLDTSITMIAEIAVAPWWGNTLCSKNKAVPDLLQGPKRSETRLKPKQGRGALFSKEKNNST